MLRPSSNSPQLPACRWAWCSKSFLNPKDLVNHVVNDHINTSKPMRRGDLPALMRAEEGLGDSMSMNLAMMAGYSQGSDLSYKSASQDKTDSQPSIEPGSSLPSPPRSEGSESPVHNPSIARDQESQQHPELSIDTANARPLAIDNGRTTGVYATPLSTKGHRDSTPSFAALSSPEKTFEIGSIPPSPSLAAMVSSTSYGRPNKRKRDEFMSSMSRLQLPHSASVDSHISQGSMASIREVEEDLTQSLDDEDAEVELRKYIHTDQLEFEPSLDVVASDVYENETFRTQRQSQSQSQASQPLQPIAIPIISQASQPVDSQESVESQVDTSTSSLEPPPPAQRPRESSSLPTTQSDVAALADTSNFAPQEQRWYGISHLPTSDSTFQTQASAVNLVSPSNSLGRPARRGVFTTGTLPPFNSMNWDFTSPKIPRRDAAVERAPDGGPIHLHHDEHPDPPATKRPRFDEGEATEDQEETDSDEPSQSQTPYYPPLQTQAPYQSQSIDMSQF